VEKDTVRRGLGKKMQSFHMLILCFKEMTVYSKNGQNFPEETRA
jgi:hypothetical protein